MSLEYVSLQLASITIVLPAIFIWENLSTTAISLIVPINMLGVLIGNVAAPPTINKFQYKKYPASLASVVLCILYFSVVYMTTVQDSEMKVFFYLVACFCVGLALGLQGIADQDTVAQDVRKKFYGSLYISGSFLGGIITFAFLVLLRLFMPGTEENGSHVMLLDFAAGLMLTSSIIVLLAQEKKAKKATTPNYVENLKFGYKKLSETWYKHYFITSQVVLVISLSPLFYTVHALKADQMNASTVGLFVLAMSIGFSTGGLMWKRFMKKNIVLPLILSGVITFFVSMLALMYQLEIIPQTKEVYAILFVFIAIAIQGKVSSLNAYMAHLADSDEIAGLVSFARTTRKILAFVVALALGVLAEGVHPVASIVVCGLVALTLILIGRNMMTLVNQQTSDGDVNPS